MLDINGSEHDLFTDAVGTLTWIAGISVAIEDTIHQLNDSCWNDATLIETLTVQADDGSTFHTVNGDLIIGSEGDTVYPKGCVHSMVSESAGELIFKRVLSSIGDSFISHYSTNIEDIPVVYSIGSSDSSHALVSTKVSPQFIDVASSSIFVTSESPWGWNNNSYHQMTADEVLVIPSVNTYSSSIKFSLEPTIKLMVTVAVDNCEHMFFSKNIISGVDSSVIEHISSTLRTNTLYRRTNV